MAPKVHLSSDTARGVALVVGGMALVGVGALIPVPTGGGPSAVAAGFAVLLGFAAILLGGILYLMATRV